MPTLISVNIGEARASRHTGAGLTGIDKRPTQGPVAVSDPGQKGVAGSGLAGDAVCDLKHHGGSGQAVYAYAREDLDVWEAELGRRLACGTFGENLTTRGINISQAQVGERWQVGQECQLQVTAPRIPCRTFAGWLGEQAWVRRFTERGAPGAYLRVIQPGLVCASDEIAVISQPRHGVTVNLMFRALTAEKHLLPRLLAAGSDLLEETRDKVLRWEQAHNQRV